MTLADVDKKIRDFEEVERLIAKAAAICKKYGHSLNLENANFSLTPAGILDAAYVYRSRLVRKIEEDSSTPRPKVRA